MTNSLLTYMLIICINVVKRLSVFYIAVKYDFSYSTRLRIITLPIHRSFMNAKCLHDYSCIGLYTCYIV